MVRPLTIETGLVVVNRPEQGRDRVVLTADRGKFWLAGNSRLWQRSQWPVRGRGRISFWPKQLKGELAGWQPEPDPGLEPAAAEMVAGWLSWLNRQLEITPVNQQPDPDLDTSRCWRIFSGSMELLKLRGSAELAGAYFYLQVFDLTGQAFQLMESSDRQPLSGDRFRFNSEQCCFEPAVAGRYGQRHIKLLRCLAAVEPRLVAQISAPGRLLAETWRLIQAHPSYQVVS